MSDDFYLENLYRYEGAGTSVNASTNPSANLNGGPAATSHVNMAEVGLAVGDVISASAVVRNNASSDNVRIEVRFQTAADGGGSTVSTVTNSYANLTSYTRVTLENITIPATAVSFHMFLRRQAGTGNIVGHKGMLNRGPTAAAYARPWRGSTFTPPPLWAAYSRARLQPVHVDSMFEPFGQRPVTQTYNAGMSDFWEANLTTLIEEAPDMRRFIAWANAVGLHGRVALRDALQTDPGEDTRLAMINGYVNGAGQQGANSLVTDGWDSGVIVRAGDYLETGQRLYMATADVRSSGGAATIPVWPTLVGPTDNALVHVNRPHLHAMLLNVPELDYFAARLAQRQSLAFREDK